MKQKAISLAILTCLACATINLFTPVADVSAADSFAMGLNNGGEFINELRSGETVQREFQISNQGGDPFDIEVSVGPYYEGDDIDNNSLESRPHTEIAN